MRHERSLRVSGDRRERASVPPMPHAPCLMPYHPPMPLIRCPKCGQAYDIPGVIAVRLPNSIATCHCGEWLAGSKAAVLARMLNPQEIKEVDLQPYRVEMPALPHEQGAVVGASDQPFEPRTVRIITSGVK